MELFVIFILIVNEFFLIDVVVMNIKEINNDLVFIERGVVIKSMLLKVSNI